MSFFESAIVRLSDAQVREKLWHRGPASLSDAELLSILLGKGEGGLSALELAEKVLQKTGNLLQLSLLSPKELRMVENLGLGRAAHVATALELGRRFRAQEALSKDTLESDRDVIELFQPRLATLIHEEFWVVYLNTSNKILEQIRISQGGISGTVVDVRLIIKRALERLASAILLVHNHPSGNPAPSDQDRQITRQISQAAALFDIRVIDHIIITAGSCHSFRRDGFFDEFEAHFR